MAKNLLNKGKKGGMQIVTLCISTTMVLVLLGVIAFFVLIARNVSNSVKENLTVTLLLTDSTSVNDGHMLTRDLYHRPYTNFIDYIGKDEVLRDETRQLGIDPSEFLDENPFTSSIELTLVATYANADSLKWIEKEWRKNKAVSDIIYQKDLLEIVNNNIQKIGLILLVLVAIFLIISISLINNTIRLGVYSQRFKMHTMKLVGASYGFIRRPYMWRMLLVGLLSSVFACVILSAGLYALYSFEPEIQDIITPEMMIMVAAAVVVLGLLISLACGFVSVERFLKMKAGDLYKI